MWTTSLSVMPGMPPDPEWSPLERVLLPFVYHGLSISSATVFTVWCFAVCALTGGMAVLAFTALDVPAPAAALLVVVSLWCGLSGEALRRHTRRLRRHTRLTRPDER